MNIKLPKIDWQKTWKGIKKAAPVIFGVAAGAGTVVAVVVSAKDTVKAQQAIAEAREAKGEELTKKEKLAAAAPEYVRTAVVTAVTVGFEITSVVLGKKAIAAAIAPGTLGVNRWLRMKQTAPDRIRDYDDKYLEHLSPVMNGSEEILCHERLCDQWFTTTWLEIRDAELWMNYRWNCGGWFEESNDRNLYSEFLSCFSDPTLDSNAPVHPCFVNEKAMSANQYGWSAEQILQDWEGTWLNIVPVKRVMDNGTEYYEILFSSDPLTISELDEIDNGYIPEIAAEE